ncbi:MAG: tetratricopeptide repeat protein [Sphingomonadaceae bacterium]
MIDPGRTLGEAHAALQAGRLDEARRLIEAVERGAPAARGPAAHLKALVERRAGRIEAARQAFATALALIPSDPNLHNNHGNFLDSLGDSAGAIEAYARAVRLKPDFADAHANLGIVAHAAGDHVRARAALETAVRLNPGLARAWSALGLLLRDLDEREAAAAALDRALALQPGLPRALAGRALLAAERGEGDADRRFRAARAASPADRDLLLSHTGVRLAAADRDALDELAAAVEADPLWVVGQQTLAKARFEAGEGLAAFDRLEAATARNPAQLDLWMALIQLEGAARPPSEMRARVAEARRHLPGAGILEVAEAEFALRDGEPEAGLALLERAEAGALPLAEPVARIGARIAIRLRQPERAALLLDRARAEQPMLAADMGLWGLTETAWRLADDPRHAWLVGHDGLWRAHELALESKELDDIAAHMRRLHVRKAHPLDQSLRGGTQTEGTLFWRADPPVQRLARAIGEAVTAHANALGPVLPGHPTLGAPPPLRAGWRFTGSWSVRLTGAGFHVAHVHPEGWLSSACYLALPDLRGEEGQLVLGEPPSELATGLSPLDRIVPAIGRLALFPSWLWHGTRPFSAGERMTVAFDVIAG